jgi:hypothetical protein
MLLILRVQLLPISVLPSDIQTPLFPPLLPLLPLLQLPLQHLHFILPFILLEVWKPSNWQLVMPETNRKKPQMVTTMVLLLVPLLLLIPDQAQAPQNPKALLIPRCLSSLLHLRAIR